MTDKWMSMVHAPKDGTPIIVLLERDEALHPTLRRREVAAVFWFKHEDGDYWAAITDLSWEEHIEKEAVGWIPFPDTSPTSVFSLDDYDSYNDYLLKKHAKLRAAANGAVASPEEVDRIAEEMRRTIEENRRQYEPSGS